MAETYLLEKLKSVELTYQELTRRLADPDVVKNPNELQQIARARSSLEDTVNTYQLWKRNQEELSGARQILKEAGGDNDLREMASLEVNELEEQTKQLEKQLMVHLLPKDPNDE